jgi:PAS domain S-box-containing protein
MILAPLLQNFSLLVALIIASGFIDKKFPRNTKAGRILQGILFGLVAITGMAIPLVIPNGVIFDGRSVVISIASLFFGPLTGIIAGVMSLLFRISIGGPGVVPGILVIISSAVIGIIFHYKAKKRTGSSSPWQLYYMGLITHAAMLAMMFSLSFESAIAVIEKIGLSVIVIYPLATLLIGKILSDQEENTNYLKTIEAKEKRYHAFIDNSLSGILLFGSNEDFLSANPAALEMLKYSEDEFRIICSKGKFPFCEQTLQSLIINRNKNEIVKGEYKLYKNDGESFDAEVFITSFPGPDDLLQTSIVMRNISERKKIEEGLKNSEQKFRNIFENSMVGISITDPKGGMNTNKAFCRMLGYSEDELQLLNWQDITHPDNINFDTKIINLLISGEKDSFRWEKKYISKSGKTIWADVNTYLLRNDSGQPLYFITAVYDITERIMTGKTLEESRSNYSYMFHSNPQPMWFFDLETLEFLEVNNAAIHHYGYTREEFLSMNIKEIRPEEELPALFDDIERTKHGFNDYREWQHIKKNGDVMVVEVTSLPIEFKGRKAKHVMINDITERKRTEDQLKKLSLAVEHSPALVIITDKEGCIEYVNKKVFEITGYTQDEVIGKNPRIWKSGFHKKNFYQELWGTILSGRTFKSEMLNRRKDGGLYWESALISALRNTEGKITNFISVNEDITAKKKMIEELIDARDRAEQSANLKTEFLAQMSHEIRSPLNAIVGIVAFLKDMFTDRITTDNSHWFESLDMSTKRIIRTVELILHTAELQTNGYNPNPVSLNLDKDILSGLAKEFQSSANQKGLIFIYNCKEKDTSVIADEYSLGQVFANLIGNAIKYTDKGKINIEVYKNNSGRLIVEIRDTGIGISKEFYPKIFEPFTQEEQGYSRSYEGNGLGLALVKKYCELNNLRIEFESEKYVGSTFRIMF